jgi:O-antigen/teichoic acid export membrane protein
MTGTTIAQAIPIVISPILTRLYTPEDFGILALFTSVTSVFGAIANGRYELAILLPDDDEDALNVAALGLSITLSMALLLMICAFLFNDQITSILNSNEIGPWLYLAPFAVLFTGLFNVLNYYNTRMCQFKALASANIQKSFVLASVQMIGGLFKGGAWGLIVGQLLSQLAANRKLVMNVIGTKEVYKKLSWSKMKFMAKRYRNFPKLSMWAILANSLSTNMTNVLVSTFYSVSTLGFYSLGQRILGLPMALIGSSVGQVYFQEATREKMESGKAVKIFISTSIRLAAISALLFVPLYVVVEELFVIVFGNDWRIAGEYVRILIPFFAIRLVVSPLSVTSIVFERQLLDLVWHFGFLFLTMIAFVVATYLELEFKDFLYSITMLYSLYFLLLYLLVFRLAVGWQKSNDRKA